MNALIAVTREYGRWEIQLVGKPAEYAEDGRQIRASVGAGSWSRTTAAGHENGITIYVPEPADARELAHALLAAADEIDQLARADG